MARGPKSGPDYTETETESRTCETESRTRSESAVRKVGIRTFYFVSSIPHTTDNTIRKVGIKESRYQNILFCFQYPPHDG